VTRLRGATRTWPRPAFWHWLRSREGVAALAVLLALGAVERLGSRLPPQTFAIFRASGGLKSFAKLVDLPSRHRPWAAKRKNQPVKKSKFLPVLGLLVASGLVAVAVTGIPDRAGRATPGPSAPMTTVSGTAPEIRSPESLPGLAAAAEPSSRVAVPTGELAAGTWVVRGHVRRGTYGTLPNALLALRLYSGTEATGSPRLELELHADERGDFTWSGSPPFETSLVEVVPVLEGHKVGAATRVVLPGDAAPDDLTPYAYWLDARILGRVIDEEGEPVPGARVLSDLSEVVTTGDGAFSLPMDSTYPAPTIRAIAHGFAEGVMAVGSLAPGDVLAGDLVLRGDYAVEGRVIDAQGDPVPGAAVCTYPRERNQTSTDDQGRFRLGQLDPSKQRTRVSALMEGYVAAAVHVGPEDAATPLEIVLGRGSSVAGHVVTRDGAPVPGAAVSVGYSPASSGPRSTRTDATGAFSIAVIPPGAQSVWALREGYAAGREYVELPEEGTEVNDIRIVLELGQRIAGVVLDEDGEPLPGAQITPQSEGFNSGASSFVGRGTTSDDEGRFQLEALREDRVVLRVWAEGCSVLEQPVSAGSTDVLLRPKRAGRLAGRVVDGRTGKPVESFVVRFVAPEAAPKESRLSSYAMEWSQPGVSFVDTDGYWTSGLEPLEMGAVTGVEVSSPGYAVAVVGQAVVARDPAADAILVELVSGTRLTGIVVDSATGAPLPRARVRRFTDGDPDSTSRYLPDPGCVAETDAQGRFTMERVPSGSMYLFADGTSLPLAIDGPFEVPPRAGSIARTVEVGTGGRLTGKLFGGDGQALADEKVSLFALDLPGDDRRFEATTDADGAYSFDGLTPGQYHLSWALTRGGRTVGNDLLRLVEIEQVRTLEFDLRPEGRATLRGTIEFDGELPDDLAVMLRTKQEPSVWAKNGRAAIVEDRQFVATHLDPGEWTVQVFVQADGQMIHGGAKAEVPAEGTVSVSVPLTAIRL
jgi:protocatechuate 3,4-dioxygenase beta subunit